ncbi:MAG: nucleotide pyrophosphohydrolase [Candidatus Kerfeldbacteria bacterium]|nr:nucleotide pyrophosphohydrolase [Candidatus Kerfeldbacteria bacterium]
MSLREVQQEVDNWAQQYKVPYWPVFEQLTRLTEEVGELARELNHRYGSKPKKSTEKLRELEDELGDIIFTITALANSQGLDLDAAWKRVMNKCYGRDKDRFAKKQRV